MAASSSCWATVFSYNSRKNAEGKSSVGQDIKISGRRLTGEESAGESGILSLVLYSVNSEVDVLQ